MNNGTADIGDIIGKLTENPEMMKNLMNVAGSLMKNGGTDKDTSFSDGRSEKDEYSPQCKEGCEHPLEHKDRGCCDNKGHHKGKRYDDAENLIRLLCALKPYVGPERCSKIDNIVKILKLIQLSEKTGLLTSLI